METQSQRLTNLPRDIQIKGRANIQTQLCLIAMALCYIVFLKEILEIFSPAQTQGYLSDLGQPALIQWTIQPCLPFGALAFSFWCFPGGSSGKELTCQSRRHRDVGLFPESGRSPGGKHDNRFPVFLPGESHGQRSMVDYTPQGCKELGMTEVSQHTHYYFQPMTTKNLSIYSLQKDVVSG